MNQTQKTILVLEDDKLIADEIYDILSEQYKVIVTNNLRDAVYNVDKVHIDAAIIDVVITGAMELNGVSVDYRNAGVEFADYVVKIKGTIPIVLLTSTDLELLRGVSYPTYSKNIDVFDEILSIMCRLFKDD